MKEVTIEKGTTYDELTDEQQELLDGIQIMINEMKDVEACLREATDYNDPRLGGFVPSFPAGFRYTITADMDKFRVMKERIDNLYDAFTKAVSY